MGAEQASIERRSPLTVRERLLLWFGAVGAPLAWSAHFTIGYWYGEAACDNRTGIEAITPLTIVITALLGATALAAGLVAAANLRSVRAGRLPDPRQRLHFMAIAGILAAIVFGFAIVLEGLLPVLLDGCGQS